MRPILTSICLLMTIGSATAAEPSGGDKAVVVSLVRKAVNAWSSNDIEAATRYLSPSIVITDSTAPYLFQGPTAVSDWLKSFAAEAKANDITDPWETLGKPTEVEVDGPHAYVAFPAVYGFRQHGKPVRVNSTVTVALEKSDKDWSIVSWTWSKR
jgi:SnoaL-like domain